jgi:hypothetical protein
VAAVADDQDRDLLVAQLDAQLLQSREQEALLLDAVIRVLTLIEHDRTL